MKDATILVTGATGFLGGALVRSLHLAGRNVLATGRNAAAGRTLEDAGIAFTACDLAKDIDTLAKLATRSTYVVHCAALSSPWGKFADFHAANIVATNHVLAACKEAKIDRLIAISTPSVSFAFAPQRDLREDAPWLEPAANHYIATKRLAERAVLTSGIPSIVLRPKALFGPGDTTLIPRVLKVAARGRFPLFGEDCLLDLTWINDAVAAIELSLTASASSLGKVYQITSGQPLSRRLVLETLFAACGLTVTLRPLPLSFALGLGSALEWISRLATLSNWEPPLTRYSVGALGYGQTLDISAARNDLLYAPQTDILARLQDCGHAWRNQHPSL
jgi:nucleoside-diphosphate-sugar epimerase